MSRMNFIERLLTGVIEKGISAKPKIGNYGIDIDYIKDGVEYTIIKNNFKIAVITKYVTGKKTTVKLTELIDDSDTDKLFFAVGKWFFDFDVI